MPVDRRTGILLFRVALLLPLAIAPIWQGIAHARSAGSSLNPGPRATRGDDTEDALPRIQCAHGYAATIYAQGLSSPDGLAFSPTGVLHVSEETAGRVSQIGPAGQVTPVITGLNSPEGITFDDSGNLYVVEDRQAGRLMKRASNGPTTTLTTDLDAPEGIVWTSDDVLYVTESNAQFTADPTDLRAHVTAVSSSGLRTRIVTFTPTIQGTEVEFRSYAGLTIGPEGLLYVTNELSGQEETIVVIPGVLTFTLSTTDSVLTVDPATGAQTLFASDLVAPEGLRFSDSGEFPLYVAEEDTGGGGRLSRVEPDGSHTPVCTGFFNVEDVTMDQRGWLYVSEDSSGLLILIKPPHVWLPLILKTANHK
jgi:sugar lactone lactonase YvrE